VQDRGGQRQRHVRSRRLVSGDRDRDQKRDPGGGAQDVCTPPAAPIQGQQRHDEQQQRHAGREFLAER
jgi:hypothetical protein